MNRIEAIVNLIDPVDTIIDIGTDHGQVIVEAFKQNKIKSAIATDIKEGPLDSAKQTIKKHNLLNKTSFYLTDGFLAISESFDAAIITGMGYKTISKILSAPHKTPKYYILGAQSQLEELRIFLMNNNFKIIDEDIYYDKKDYIFLKVIRDKQILTEEEILLGPILKTKNKAIKYYKQRVKTLQILIKNTNIEKADKYSSDIQTFKTAISKLLKNHII